MALRKEDSTKGRVSPYLLTVSNRLRAVDDSKSLLFPADQFRGKEEQ